MKLKSHLKRLIWPSILLVVAVCLMVFDEVIERHVGLSFGLAGGVLGCLAAAWTGSRLFGLATDRRRNNRPSPRLFRDLVAILLFFVAIVVSAALLLGQGIVGALAGSSLILAMLGFAIRNIARS